MYNIKDNAEWRLKIGISATTTAILIEEWDVDKFPQTPFLVVLNARNDSGEITKSETIEVTATVNNQRTVTRWFEWSAVYEFDAGDFVSLFILVRHIEDIKQEFGQYAGKQQDNTFGGTNVFTKSPKVPLPQEDTDAVNKEYIDKTIAHSSVIDHLTEARYPLGEPVTKNDCLFVEDAGRIEDITSFQEIGKTTANQKVAYRIMGNGVSGNSISLPLCAVGNSPIPLTVRIEGGENQPNGQLVHTQAQATISKTQMAYHPIVIEAGYDRDESTSNRYNAITFTAKRDFVCVGLIKSTRCNATGAELKIGGATKTTGTVTGNTIIRSQAQVITAGQQVELWATGGTRKAAKWNSSYTVNTDYFTLNTPYDFESLLLVDCATVSFPASFTIPSTAWVVLSQGTNTVNSTNYYGLGLREKHSSTRYLATNNGSWKVLKQNSITNRENNVAGGTFNDGQKNTWRGTSLVAKNTVSITRIDKINGSQANKVRIVKNGAIVWTYNLSGNTATISPAIAIEKGEKFTIEFAKGNNEYYVSQGFNMANSSNGTADFHDAKYSENGAITGGSNQWYNLNKIFVTTTDYPNNSSVITGAWLHTQVLAKTNASHPYKISWDGYARFAQSAGATGTIVPVSYYGQHSGMNGLIPGMRYYLSGAPGLITTNASDGVLECGLALTSTTLLTTGVKGKIYSFQQQLRTNLQTHSHPLINQARFVVVSYGDYESHRQKIATFSATSVIGSSNYRTNITRVGDTITHRTNSTPYYDSNITFTFFL